MVVGVNTGGLLGGDSAAVVEPFVRQTGVTFPVGWDTGKSHALIGPSGGVSPFPIDVIVDQQGKVAYVSRRYEPTAMRSVIDALQQRQR